MDCSSLKGREGGGANQCGWGEMACYVIAATQAHGMDQVSGGFLHRGFFAGVR